MKNKVQTIIILFLCCLFFQNLIAEDRVKLSSKERRKMYRELRSDHKNWFNMITYIATEEEKNVFLMLKNDRDRNVFIRTFWLQRDPTPGTPENEYKNEITKRFIYVNKEFKKGSSKPGWMTDMGKFYMILGKPVSIDRYDSKKGLYPAQVWYYHGDKSLGLPSYFNVMFFKPRNTTEWKFYSPTLDGPESLVISDQSFDLDNQMALYEKIMELAPGLASPAVTMIPNEYSPGLKPSLRTNIIVTNIYDSPKRKINASYATNFLKYKGFVNIDDSVNYIDNTHLVSISRNERFPFNFLNISLKPKKISVGYNDDKDKYFFNFELTVSLKKGENFIYQYNKNFEFYIEPDKVNNLRGNGVVIHDTFPVIPGKYTLTVFAKNAVGQEFTFFDKEIKVPSTSTMPHLGTALIGYKSEGQPANFFYPYKVKDKKLFVDTENTFKLKERPYLLIGVYNLNRELWQSGKVKLTVNGLSDRLKYKKTFNLPLNKYEFRENLNILFMPDKEGFSSDYYEVNLQLVNDLGIVLDSKGTEFTVSPFSTTPYPMETFKRSRLDNPYYFYYMVGTQYESAEIYPEAIQYYEKTVENNPDFWEGQARYLNLLNRQKEYTKVLVKVEKLKGSEKFAFEYHLIKGTALFGMEDYENALVQLMKANEIYDSDIRVLNLLGFTFINLKEYKEALKAFDASLLIDGSQSVVKETINKVKQQIEINNLDNKEN